MFSLSCSLALPPPLFIPPSPASVCLRACSFSRPRFDGPSAPLALRLIPMLWSFSVLRILSRAALGSKCITHARTHTHTELRCGFTAALPRDFP